MTTIESTPVTHKPAPVAPRDEAVAITSRAAVEGTQRRLTAAFVTAFFFAVIFGCAGIDLFWPVPAPKLVGFEKKQQDDKRSKARFADGTLAKLVEDDLKLTSRVRRTANAVYAPLLLRGFREAGPSHVAGPNYFLFRRDRIKVAEPRDEVIGLSTGRLRALDRRLGHLGSRLVVVPLPRKEVVMARELPPGIEVHPEYDQLFAASLREAGVDFVDLLPAFTAAEGDPVYPAADSHWSANGALIAARAIATALLQPGERLHEPRFTKVVEDSNRMFAHALGLDPMAQPLMPYAPLPLLYFVDRKVVNTTSKPPDGELPILLTGTSFSKHTTDESTFFVEALSAVLGKPIWNGARSGVTGLQSLDTSLRAIAGRQLPKVIVVEQPNHYSLSFESPMTEISDLFARMPVPDGLQSLQHDAPDRFGLPRFGNGETPTRVGMLLTQNAVAVPTGLDNAFVYPRDGTVGLHVRGRPSGPGAMLSVDRGRSKHYTHWPTGRDDALLPLAGDRLGQNLDIYAWGESGPVAFELHSIAIVCDLDLEHGRIGSTEKRNEAVLGETFSRWSESITFQGEPLADACVGIEIEGPAGAPQLRQVDALFADGTTKTLYGPKELLPTARLLLPLGPQARALTRILVRGHGQPPAAPIRAFWLPRIGR